MTHSDSFLSVVIPVYNEEATICEVLDALLKRSEIREIIVIDDASTDRSGELIESYKETAGVEKTIKYFKQSFNMGKGAAITMGFGHATAPYVIVQDADLEYSPDDYSIILEPILKGKADVVYGSRFRGGPGRVLYYKHQLGNKLIVFLSNLFTDLNLTDVETCYKAFRRDVIQNINLESKRFGIEIEITAKIAKVSDLRIYEVSISYNGRTYKEGKKITWKDGVAALWFIFKYNLFQNRAKFYKLPWGDVLKT